MQKQTKPKPLGAPMAKLVLVVAIIASLGAVLGILGYTLTKPKPAFTPIPKTISAIEISEDAKSILNAETGEVIFTIDDANKYLKYSGYAYDPDTFQNTNKKYAGDCFEEAKLSNDKKRIVFSTGCLPGDLPHAWIGSYDIPDICAPTAYSSGECHPIVKFRFLIAGSGRNFVWSSDDKTITYEADLGLSGMTEIRTIDARTGEILDTKKEIENPETSCRNLCGDGICQEIVCMAIGCPCAETPQSCPQDCQKNETGTENWKTYRNEEYGFEVKYPQDWIIKDVHKSLSFTKILIEPPKTITSKPIIDAIVIDIDTASKINTAEDYLNKNILIDPYAEPQKFKKFTELFPNYKIVKVDNTDGIQHESEVAAISTSIQKIITTALLNNKSAIEIIADEEYTDIYNQMLSTFKFIEKEEKTN